ncbi:hypothetical protein LPJ64_005895 [Coemansia asiatica]|uniref:Phytanoyl-CoA dioxygenase n=1 Tax=Coemansia asiatica TaxID=1052880 RepID=A0A9W7XG61_9FUNG|nr:hypothetical protein LPJ64_005895 [Coemansia asiatica]
MLLTQDQVSFYCRNGYLIVDKFLTPKEIETYAEEAQMLVNHCYEHGDIVTHWGCVIEPFGCELFDSTEVSEHARTTHKGFVSLRSSLFGSSSAATCTLDKFGRCAEQLLLANSRDSDKIYLLNDQYIVKPPHEASAQFAWHQDILYFSKEERQYPVISAWTPLSNVDEHNGTVLVDPFPNSSCPGVYTDLAHPQNARVFPAVMSAGSVLFMDGRLRHCSMGNSSSHFRTVYMPQFSLGRMVKQEATNARYTALAVPLDDMKLCLGQDKA